MVYKKISTKFENKIKCGVSPVFFNVQNWWLCYCALAFPCVFQGCEPQFKWTYPDDFKPVPQAWVCALNVHVNPVTGYPVPDENGHVPGEFIVA